MPPIQTYYQFTHGAGFDAGWATAGMTDSDLLRFQVAVVANPELGDAMKGTGGLRKARWAPGGKGKSGGARVCYAVFHKYHRVLLLAAFPKSAKVNLSAAERNDVADLLKEFEDELEKYVEAGKGW